MMKTMKSNILPMNLQRFADGDGTGEPPAFDPSSLSPEALAYMQSEADRRVTAAVKTANKNTRESLLKDDKFRSQIRSEIEAEQQLSVEEKLAEQRKLLEQDKLTLAIGNNKLEVKNVLLEGGLTVEKASELADVITNSDLDLSKKNAELFVNTLKTLTSDGVEKAKQELLTGGLPLNQGDGKNTTYQDQYTQFIKSGDRPSAIAIKQKAFAEGIVVH